MGVNPRMAVLIWRPLRKFPIFYDSGTTIQAKGLISSAAERRAIASYSPSLQKLKVRGLPSAPFHDAPRHGVTDPGISPCVIPGLPPQIKSLAGDLASSAELRPGRNGQVAAGLIRHR